MSGIVKVDRNRIVNMVAKSEDFMKPLAQKKGITLDVLKAAFVAEFSRTPKLAECTPASVVGGIYKCLQMGLLPGSGDVYLVPKFIKNSLQMQAWIGYKGLAKLARRAGIVEVVDHTWIFEKEEIDYQVIDGRKILSIKPNLFRGNHDTEALLCVVYLKTKTGETVIGAATKGDADFAKQLSDSKNSNYSPWFRFYNKMWLKTTIKMAMDKLPQSDEMAIAMDLDSKAMAGLHQNLHREIAPIEGDKNQFTEEIKTIDAVVIEQEEEKVIEKTTDEASKKSEKADAAATQVVENKTEENPVESKGKLTKAEITALAEKISQIETAENWDGFKLKVKEITSSRAKVIIDAAKKRWLEIEASNKEGKEPEESPTTESSGEDIVLEKTSPESLDLKPPTWAEITERIKGGEADIQYNGLPLSMIHGLVKGSLDDDTFEGPGLRDAAKFPMEYILKHNCGRKDAEIKSVMAEIQEKEGIEDIWATIVRI